MHATQPSSMSEALKHKVSRFGFTTIALALLVLLTPASRAQRASPHVAQLAPASPVPTK